MWGFGSFARGEKRIDRDVDFLVGERAGPSIWFPGGLVMDLEVLVGRKVDVVKPEGLRPRLKDRILIEAISL